MIEVLGPNMARTIVGDDYSPDCKYELETDDEGLMLIVTNKETGESSSRRLPDTSTPQSHLDPIYDKDREEALLSYGKQTIKGYSLALLVAAICVAVACFSIWILVRVVSGV